MRTLVRKQLLVLLLCITGASLNAQIFYSTNGTTNVAAQQVGEPNQPNGTVKTKAAPTTTPDNRVNARTAYENAGIPNSIIYNSRFLGDGVFARQISDMWATKQTAKNVRKVTSRSANPPAASNAVIYINSRQILDNNRNRIASNDNLTFVFQGWINPGWPIAVGSNTTIWIDGILSYNGFDAPRTATGAAFTPRPSKYDGVFNIRPTGAFRDEPTSAANKDHNTALLNQKFKGPNRFTYAIENVNVFGTRRGEILVAQGNYTDPSNQKLPQVNGLTVMNASKITIEGVTIKNSFQGLFLSQLSFDVNINNNFIDNSLYRAFHLKGAWNTNGWGSVKNNLLTNSKFDGIDLDSYVSSFNVNENVVIGARDRLLIWTEIDAFKNTINNNVGIVLDAATEGNPIGNAGKGAYQENGTEKSREGVPGFNGTNNNKWTNNHSFYAERAFDGFVMRKDRFIQFNTIEFTNNYVWTTKADLDKHNPKSGVTNDVYYLVSNGGASVAGAPINQVISLRKTGGDRKYVTGEADASKLIARSNVVLGWEQFLVESHPNGGVTLKALSNNKYVQVPNLDANAPVRNNGNFKGDWEQFEWKSKGNGKVALKSMHSGKWLQGAWNENNGIIRARGNQDLGWETFDFAIVNQSAKSVKENILAIENQETDVFKVQVYPNPVKQGEELFVNSGLLRAGAISLDVFDISGKVIYQKVHSNVQVETKLSVDTANFKSGIYFIKIASNASTSIKKILIN